MSAPPNNLTDPFNSKTDFWPLFFAPAFLFEATSSGAIPKPPKSFPLSGSDRNPKIQNYLTKAT